MATLKNTNIDDTGFIKPASGTTAQRPGTPSTGMIRWNTSSSNLEVYTGTSWETLNTSPSIVVNGLILLLDAGNSSSYPSTGTTWFDISGGGNNGTISGATFNTDTFDYTVNDITTVPMTNLRPTSGITQETWVQFSEAEVGVMIGSQYGTSSGNSYALWRSGASVWSAGVNTNGSNLTTIGFTTTITTGTYYHVVHTYNGSVQTLYINGVEVNSSSLTGNIIYNTSNTLLAVGNDWNGSGYDTGAAIGVRGKLAKVALYNRGLTGNEVYQNFYLTKNRFGY